MTTRTFGPYQEYPEDTVTVTVSGAPMRWFFDFRLRWYTSRPSGEFVADVLAFTERARPEWTRVHPDLASAAEFADLPLEVIQGVVGDWIDAVPEVPPPLPLGSSAGAPSAEPSTPAQDGASPSPRRSRRQRSTTG